MKKVILLVLVMLGFTQVSIAADYSKMSASELSDAFVLAVKKNSPEEVQEVLRAGADVNTPIPDVWTHGDCDWNVKTSALAYAVRHDCPDLVRVLKAEKAQLNAALDIAIEEGRLGVVEALIKIGADVNCVDKNGDTPLIKAVQHARATGEFYTQAQAQYRSRWQDRRQIIQSLLKSGADVKHANKYGRTALMQAAVEADLHTVQSLLKIPEMTKGSYFGLGARPINYADNDGNTALMLALNHVRTSYYDSYGYAVCVNSQKIVQELVETPGIDVYHVNKKGDVTLKLIEAHNKRASGQV